MQPKDDFWDLHRRLAECYMSDVAVSGKPHGPQPPMGPMGGPIQLLLGNNKKQDGKNNSNREQIK